MLVSSMQAYVPMLEQGNKWNELLSRHDMGQAGSSYSVYIRKISGTQIVEENTYCNLTTTQTEDTTQFFDYVLMREDVSAQRVYLHYNGEDLLLYDFNVEPNDTVYALAYRNDTITTKLVVNNISYIKDQLDNDLKVIELKHFSESSLHIKWIEGYGTYHGILPNLQQMTGSPYYDLLCAYKNNTLTFEGDKSEEYGCYIWDEHHNPSNNQNTTSNNQNIIFDNESLSLIVNSQYDASVLIFNMQGQLIQQAKTSADNSSIKISATKGIYSVLAIDTNGNRTSIKILIN